MELSPPDACGPQDVYRPRNPRAGAYYQCVESHFEELEQLWDDLYPVEKSSNATAKVIYTSKDGRSRKTFNALDWLALLVTHIHARYEQTVRYYGYYSNKPRGLRKKVDTDNQLLTIITGEMSSKQFRRNWARLINYCGCRYFLVQKASSYLNLT